MKLLISNDDGKTFAEITNRTDFYFQCDKCQKADSIDYYLFAQLLEEDFDSSKMTCADCIELTPKKETKPCLD